MSFGKEQDGNEEENQGVHANEENPGTPRVQDGDKRDEKEENGKKGNEPTHKPIEIPSIIPQHGINEVIKRYNVAGGDSAAAGLNSKGGDNKNDNVKKAKVKLISTFLNLGYNKLS